MSKLKCFNKPLGVLETNILTSPAGSPQGQFTIPDLLGTLRDKGAVAPEPTEARGFKYWGDSGVRSPLSFGVPPSASPACVNAELQTDTYLIPVSVQYVWHRRNVLP